MNSSKLPECLDTPGNRYWAERLDHLEEGLARRHYEIETSIRAATQFACAGAVAAIMSAFFLGFSLESLRDIVVLLKVIAAK